MGWSWGVFLASLVVCSAIVMFARGAMNTQNVARHGGQADYRSNTVSAFIGSVLAGAVLAAVITVVVGMIG